MNTHYTLGLTKQTKKKHNNKEQKQEKSITSEVNLFYNRKIQKSLPLKCILALCPKEVNMGFELQLKDILLMDVI